MVGCGGQGVEQAVVAIEVFRMPLHSQEKGLRRILHRFHHPILGAGGDKQGGRNQVHALVDELYDEFLGQE